MWKIILLFLSVAGAAEWWESGNFYQIYPRSYMDSDNDGIGDLKGIESKLDYIKELGVDGIWLSPIYKSPMADFGYDIADFIGIHNEFGTMEDFESLLNECKKRNIKLILDFVPNHSSDEHEWFKKSERGELPYKNYYIWDSGKRDPHTNLIVPPNNWNSNFRFSAWRWSPIRKQFYMHQFHYKQPDLNYRDSYLVQEMKDVLKFWMGKGVSGFRIDIIPALFEKIDENGKFPDQPLSGNPNCDKYDFCYYDNIFMMNQFETYDMAYQWRETLDQFSKENNAEYKVMMTESYESVEKVMPFYGNGTRQGSNIPFNFEIIKGMNADSSAKDYNVTIERWLKAMPTGKVANWVIGNHDQHRAASRLGESRGDLLNILVQTLPGVAITYQGEELVLTNIPISWEDTLDPQACNSNKDIYYQRSRDPARTPFPWDDSQNGGFSKAEKTWLPVGELYKTKNVKAQQTAANSHLKIYKKLVQLRKQNVLKTGTFEAHLTNNDKVMVYKREVLNGNVVVVVLNFDRVSQQVNLKTVFPNIPANMYVYTSSLDSGLTEGSAINMSAVTLGKDIGAVFIKTRI